MIQEKVIETYRKIFGEQPQFLVRAPGRANLIGEHTDYHDGFVMPLAVDRAVWLAIAPRSDNHISVHTLDFGNEMISFGLDQLQDSSLPHWTKHVRGAWWLVAHQEGKQAPGVNIVIGSDIPMGSGMSSSAAIEVAMIEAALALLGETSSYTQAQKALLAVEIEHQFMGMPCGILDQMASAAALEGTAMLLDCRSFDRTPAPIPDSVRVVVMNTMKSRELGDSGYATRRRESESAAQLLGVKALRDATMDMIDAKRTELGDVRYRRAKHVVTENERTLQMKAILESHDLQGAGKLLNASHISLRDDYEVSVYELDVMSEIAQSHPACYGARMMGGGFGGCAVGLVNADAIDDFLNALQPRYTEKTGKHPEFYVCVPAAGSGVTRL
ncbi:MAG: galactokinase [Anaerolineae bacterium]|nr:MAG: galactokinase [Anaerolineae bacterium]